MKTILIIGLILVSIVLVSSQSISNKPDADTEFTQDEKNKLTAKFDTYNYTVTKDWTINDEYCSKVEPIDQTICIQSPEEEAAKLGITVDDLMGKKIIDAMRKHTEETVKVYGTYNVIPPPAPPIPKNKT